MKTQIAIHSNYPTNKWKWIPSLQIMRISTDSGKKFSFSSKGQFLRPQRCSLASRYNHQWEQSMCALMEMEMDVLPKTWEIQLIQVAGSCKLSPQPGNLLSPISPASPLILHLLNNPLPQGQHPKLAPSPNYPWAQETLQLLGEVGPLQSRRCSSSWGVGCEMEPD